MTPVQAREEQENRAMGTETESGTQIPSTIATGQEENDDDDKALSFRNIISNKSFRLWCGPRYKQEKSKRTEQWTHKTR